ncbi:hypothetical protein ACFQ1E_06415 [Sphingomonas canadensis]|uniref:Uncharacterized protein n=1 Tax=Sphingomonas canadensis TaxID=1219257 RepID=A0ABW3H8J1_9SPHN|nr:hypothetical protein [Sphingomonas canadensis]MCW3835577.1 hypothetical protein [Sphingomonas canadensis]
MNQPISQTASMLLSLATAGAILLAWGGYRMLRRGDRQKGLLMLVCSAVVAGNIAIWVV